MNSLRLLCTNANAAPVGSTIATAIADRQIKRIDEGSVAEPTALDGINKHQTRIRGQGYNSISKRATRAFQHHGRNLGTQNGTTFSPLLPLKSAHCFSLQHFAPFCVWCLFIPSRAWWLPKQSARLVQQRPIPRALGPKKDGMR